VVSDATPTGAYLNGKETRLYGPVFIQNNIIPWEVGPDAAGIVMQGPCSTGALLPPTVAAATAGIVDSGNTKLYPGVTVIDPSEGIEIALSGVPRHRISQSVPRFSNPETRIGGEMVTANGVAQRKTVITAANYQGQSTGTGAGAIGGLVADGDSYLGVAIQIAAVNVSGFLHKMPVGGALHEGDTVKVTYRYKMSATPAGGTFKYWLTKDLMGGGEKASGNFNVSETYASQSVTYTLSGFADGDTLDIGAYNSGVTDATLNIECIVIEVLDPIDVTGSAAGNAALSSLLTALETLGLITDSSS
jgi:hypothetical protein